MVWRGPGQVSGSLTRPDLSCGATFLPEDPTLAPLVLSLATGDRGFESVSLHRRVRELSVPPETKSDQDAKHAAQHSSKAEPDQADSLVCHILPRRWCGCEKSGPS
jgi:hypothetical protein